MVLSLSLSFFQVKDKVSAHKRSDPGFFFVVASSRYRLMSLWGIISQLCGELFLSLIPRHKHQRVSVYLCLFQGQAAFFPFPTIGDIKPR